MRTFERDGVRLSCCGCDCHKKQYAGAIRHIAPCCSLTYRTYLEDDGSFDNQLLEQALNDTYNVAIQRRAEKEQNDR